MGNEGDLQVVIIYFDCEFTDLVGIKHDIELISAGFVGPDGCELYFELTDNYTRDECSEFVREAVLPYLNPGKYGMTATQAAHTLRVWIEQLGDQVELATDAPGYDWPLIYGLLVDHQVWPRNLSSGPVNINTGNVQQEYEQYFTQQPLAVRHHALWDARALAFAAEIENQYWAVRNGQSGQ